MTLRTAPICPKCGELMRSVSVPSHDRPIFTALVCGACDHIEPLEVSRECASMSSERVAPDAKTSLTRSIPSAASGLSEVDNRAA